MKPGSYANVLGSPHKSKSPFILYHNCHCSKSNEALGILREQGIEPQIIEYLEHPLSKKELEHLHSLLQVEAKEMIRTNETIFSKLSVDLNNTESILSAITEHPKLLQRPILVHEGKAIIGRPPKKILEII